MFAFEDINPQAPTHILICPKKHFAALHDAEPAAIRRCSASCSWSPRNLAHRTAICSTGYRTVFNNGSGAGQSVFHLHLHLLGGRKFRWPPG